MKEETEQHFFCDFINKGGINESMYSCYGEEQVKSSLKQYLIDYNLNNPSNSMNMVFFNKAI